MADIATRGKEWQAPSAQTGAGMRPLRVKYYRRMKRQRVYPVVVTWPGKAASPGEVATVTLRMQAAGAQVVPAEQTIDSSDSNAQATFYVTPQARGRLRAQRVEILHKGRKIQDIPLYTRVASQRTTWILLLLTFLVPWFIFTYLKGTPLQYPMTEVKSGVTREYTMPLETVAAEHIKKHVPAMPEYVKENMPGVSDAVENLHYVLADVYVHVVRLSHEKPLAFYAACTLLLLTLLSAWFNRDKVKKATGKPLRIPSD